MINSKDYKFDFPKDIMIEVTNECNLRCITCYSHQDGRIKKYMSLDIFKKIINEIPDKENKTISLYNYGEPLLHSDIGKMVQYAKDNKIKMVKIATNGVLLTPHKSLELIKNGLDYISVSVDGTSQKVYEKFRVGGNLNIIIKNLYFLVELKNKLQAKLTIELQFIIMSLNENQVKDIELLAKKLKVNILRYKTVLIKEKKWKYLLPKNRSYSRYNTLIQKNYCNKPKEGIVVNVDGTVIPCCYFTGEEIKKFSLGNINDDNFLEVFYSKKYQKLIENISKYKAKILYCNRCNEGNQKLDYKIINYVIKIKK